MRWARARGAARAVPSHQRHLTSKGFCSQQGTKSHRTRTLLHLHCAQLQQELHIRAHTIGSGCRLLPNWHIPPSFPPAFCSPAGCPVIYLFSIYSFALTWCLVGWNHWHISQLLSLWSYRTSGVSTKDWSFITPLLGQNCSSWGCRDL